MTGTKKAAGADFVATVRLTDKQGAVLAMPGEACERVPPESLGWLEQDGLIRRPEKANAQPRRRKGTSEEEE